MPPNDTLENIRPIVESAKILCQKIVSSVDEFVANIEHNHRLEERKVDGQNGEVDAEMMYQMLDAAPVFLTELTGNTGELIIIRATAMVEKMFGYCTGELNGAPLSMLIPEDKREVHKQHILTLMRDPHDRQMGDSANVEPEGVDRSGERFPIELLWKRIVRRPRTYLVGTVMRQVRGLKPHDK